MAQILLGVSGGIAAYKVAPLIRLFSESGHSVQVVATKNALRFIGQTTLEALSKSKVEVVDPDLFTDVEQVKHIALAKSADLIVIAPATASLIAKIAAGISDDLLTTTILAAKVPVVVAPAMHTEMWENSATKQNVGTLVSRGFLVVEPGTGRLTGEDTGVGRLAEPEEIFKSAVSALQVKLLRGKRVLVSAGGTREPIDVARYIGNFSSGKQGIAFAKAAKEMGAIVKLIAANLDSSLTSGLDVVNVHTTAELREALLGEINDVDLLIMAAAVADFSPVEQAGGKLKRNPGELISIDLKANSDILAEITAKVSANSRELVTIGFAAEAGGDLKTLAEQKLHSKGVDFIVANDISAGKVFGSEHNQVLLVSKSGTREFGGTKLEVARAVLTEVATKLGDL